MSLIINPRRPFAGKSEIAKSLEMVSNLSDIVARLVANCPTSGRRVAGPFEMARETRGNEIALPAIGRVIQSSREFLPECDPRNIGAYRGIAGRSRG